MLPTGQIIPFLQLCDQAQIVEEEETLQALNDEIMIREEWVTLPDK